MPFLLLISVLGSLALTPTSMLFTVLASLQLLGLPAAATGALLAGDTPNRWRCCITSRLDTYRAWRASFATPPANFEARGRKRWSSRNPPRGTSPHP